MSDLINKIEFKANTLGDTVKRVVLPFAGFYDSSYQQLVDNELSELQDEQGKSDIEIQAIARNFDYKAFYSKIADGFGDYLNQCFSDVFGESVEIAFEQVEYHPMTMQNTGDEISAAVDVTKLPGLGYLQHFCETNELMDFKETLKQIAVDKFNGIGLLSSWGDNIERRFDKPYEHWESVYIECLLAAMVSAVSIDHGHNDGEWELSVRDFEYNGFAEYGHTSGLFYVEL